MNRISWHIPLGIFASLLAHVWIFSLILSGLDNPPPSQPLRQKSGSTNTPMEIEAVHRPQNSFGYIEEPESPDQDLRIIKQENTIQFR